MQERWFGVPLAVSGLHPGTVERLDRRVARWQQARRQLCLSLLLGQRPDLDDRALTAILPERPLRLEARRWAYWLVSGDHGLLAWYRQTLQAMPDDALWQREREFYAALRLQDHGLTPEGASRLWHWHRRRGLDLGPWLADATGPTGVTVPATLQPWIDHGAQPLLGQWLVWEGQWLIHLFWPGQPPEARSLPRVAAALLVPSLVSPTTTGYRVQKGDTLWGIAQSQTGSGANWRQVFEANRQQIRQPERIYPGQVLTIPGAASAPTAGTAVVPATGTIVVRPGDTLWRIARQQTGHGSWWPQLWQVNRDRLRRPERLAVGSHLRRPVSWSSGLQAAVPSVTRLPALQPSAGQEGGPPVLTVETETPPPRQASSLLTQPPAVKPQRRAIRTSPVVGRRPGQPAIRAHGALVPPPVVPKAVTSPAADTPTPPLVPTVPDVRPQPETPSASPALVVPGGFTGPGQRATPLNRSAAGSDTLPATGSETSAEPAATLRWSDPEPLQPLPEPVSQSDAAVEPSILPVPAVPSDAAAERPMAVAGPGPLPEEAPTDSGVLRPGDPPDPTERPVATEAKATLRPAQGGADPWDAWMRPEIPDPAHPQRLVGFTLPHVAPAALWPQVGWTGVPEYTTETAANQTPLAGWALNRQRLSAEWQSGSWLVRGRWTTAQYGLAGGATRADRQESWVDVDFGQRWQVIGPLRLGLLGRATWWSRRGGMGQEATLRAADLQGFGLGPVGQVEVALGGGQAFVAEAAVQPLMGISFSGPLQAAGQLGQVEGLLGWKGHWGAFQPSVGYRARWVYDADGRFGTVAHGLSAGLAIGWPGAAE